MLTTTDTVPRWIAIAAIVAAVALAWEWGRGVYVLATHPVPWAEVSP